MTQLRPYKFLVTAVVQQVDPAGNVVGEVTIGGDPSGSPVTVFGIDGLKHWADQFPDALRQTANGD